MLAARLFDELKSIRSAERIQGFKEFFSIDFM
jgi:hypothetical protein